MTEYDFSQVLIVSPKTHFAEIDESLRHLGWLPAPMPQTATPPLIIGEPEMAQWTWQGGKPFIIYTFNPVARLRVLDVATLTPKQRAAIAEKLILVDGCQLIDYLQTENPRDRLRGLWAIQETDRTEFIAEARKLTSDIEPTVSEAAVKVVSHLESVLDARIQLHATLKLLTDAAEKLIRQLRDIEFVRRLCPSAADCALMFDEAFADRAAERAAHLFEKPEVINSEHAAGIQVTAAPAGLFRFPNELSDRFPHGYRDIAGWMNPKRVWLAWTIQTTEGSSIRYDGLVWLEDHWVWLPKPYRILSPLLPR